jgi:predicted Holliday junction resolvase-like endonuclease
MDEITLEENRLDGLEEKLEERKKDLQEKAREAGRKLAKMAVKKIDPVFTPHKLNPDDAKVIFHPIDYVVFDGMKKESIKNIILLDRQEKGTDHRAVQKSIERVVEQEKYEWETLRVQEDGKIKVE